MYVYLCALTARSFLPRTRRYSFDIRQLFPVAPGEVGTELARLVGGTTMLARHAEHLVIHGGAEKLGVALEIAELAAAAADSSEEANAQVQ